MRLKQKGNPRGHASIDSRFTLSTVSKFFAVLGAAALLLATVVVAPSASAAVPTDPRFPKVRPFCFGAGAAVYVCAPQPKIVFDKNEYPGEPPASYFCEPSTGRGKMESCIIGAEESTTSIAVVGSSHARGLWPAFDIVGERENVAVHLFLLNDCHYMVTVDSECLARNMRVRPRLLSGEFDLVIFAQAVDRNENGIETVSATNYRTYFVELRNARVPYTVIKDSPRLTSTQLACFKKNKKKNPLSCTIDRALGFRYEDFAVTAATALGAPVLDFSDIYCDTTTCPLVRGGMQIYADLAHPIPGFTRTLAPFMWSEMRRLELLPIP
jgi:hypothetical protein